MTQAGHCWPHKLIASVIVPRRRLSRNGDKENGLPEKHGRWLHSESRRRGPGGYFLCSPPCRLSGRAGKHFILLAPRQAGTIALNIPPLRQSSGIYFLCLVGCLTSRFVYLRVGSAQILPHYDRSCRSNLPSHPDTGATSAEPFNARHLAE